MKIHNKLFAYSTFLTLAVMITLYLIFQQIVNSLILQKQVDSDMSSFKQETRYYKSIFENVENYIQRISIDKVITENITKPYNKTDYSKISGILTAINTEMNNIIASKVNYIDSIVILGANNYSYIYSMENSSRYLCDQFSFQSFYNNKNISMFTENDGIPLYFEIEKNTISKDSGNREIYNVLRNKIVYIRTLYNNKNLPDGMVIIIFKSTFVSDIMPKISENESLCLANSQGNIIWFTGNPTLYPSVPNSSTSPSGYNIVHKKAGGILKTYYKISPYNFQIIKQVTLQYLLRSNETIQFYSLLFGMSSFLLVIIFSYIFSNKLSKPLKELAGKLSVDSSTLMQGPFVDLKISMNNLTLRTKIISYFILLVILPNMVYSSLLTFLYYNAYKDKIVNITADSIRQVKWTTDYDIKNYDQIVLELIYSDVVQNILKEKGSSQSEHNTLDQMLLNAKMAKNGFLSISLYDQKENIIYSSTNNDTSPATSFSQDFFTTMNNSGGKFVLLGAKKDLYMNDVLCFGRLIYGSGINFGKKLGYITCFINIDVLDIRSYNSTLDNPRYIFLLNESNGDLIIDRNDINSTIIQSDDSYLANHNLSYNFLLQTKKGLNGLFTVRFDNRDILAIYDTLNLSNLKIIGIIPNSEISSKVLPLLWYSAFILILYIIFIMLISALISSAITKPLRKLQSLMGEVNNGNFNIHMNYRGKDEIGVLSNQFNNMVYELKELIYENYQSKLRESELLFLEKEAQLNALQQQINPHFLYNTLESIKWMAYKKGVMEICDMATALGKFFRGTIVKGSDLITFAEEIEHLKNYIYIQQIRYKGKFDILWEIDNAILEFKTIRLILQPIVENAITHGLESFEEGGLITIRGYKSADKIYLEIMDNGVGMNSIELEELQNNMVASKVDPDRTSIGLTNVYRRLKLHFGEMCNFVILSKERKGTTVKLTIPI